MGYPWLEEHLLAKQGVEKDYKEEWEAFRFLVKGKMFVMLGQNKEGENIATFKLEPAFSDLLRQQFPQDITPGYYMNKQHWSSLRLGGSVPDDVVRDMADRSYRVLAGSLPKKLQAELSEL